MALARCEACGKPRPKKRHYVNARPPLGHPNSGVICGSVKCKNPALVWLDDQEEADYQRGERVFSIPNGAAKLRLA